MVAITLKLDFSHKKYQKYYQLTFNSLSICMYLFQKH